MKRQLARVLAVFALHGLLVILPETPASATTDVCVGQGIVATGQGLTYPFPATGKNTSASFTFSVGACVGTGGVRTSAGIPAGLPTPFAIVNITGLNATPSPFTGAYCGHSLGVNGLAGGHHSFQYLSAGSILLVYPGAIGSPSAAGIVQVIPDITTTPPQSCLPTGPGASQFLLNAVIALV